MSGTEYLFSRSAGEFDRLIAQAAITRPLTERLLRTAGMKPGMRVLDIGCGAGDVTLLTAELIGPQGSVLGIDRDPSTVDLARRRAAADRLTNVDFRCVELEALDDPARFDMVVARYVLIHHPVPVDFLRAAARLVRPGGVLALHEMDVFRGLQSHPRVALYHQLEEWVLAAWRELAPSAEAVAGLALLFAEAGLPAPQLMSETTIAAGPESPLYAYVTNIARALLPQFVRLGIATEDEVGIDTVESRLRADALALHSQLEFVPQQAAWVRL